MESDWREQVRSQFRDWGSGEAVARWRGNRPSLTVGITVLGKVIARAPFGVWVDIGAGWPALLLVPEMAGASHSPIRFEDYPALGAVVESRILSLGERAEIGLTQRPQTVADDGHDYPHISVWSVVGNIVGERACGVDGKELRAGTRLYRPNAKVYLIGISHYWAVLNPHKDDSVIVLGQHRKSRAWISSYVRSTYVRNWRIRVVYDPAVVSRMKKELWCAFECSFDWKGGRDAPEAIEALFAAWGMPRYRAIQS